MLLALSSAALLILSFPSFNQAWGAWIALVPWFVVLQDLTPRRAFGWSYFVGLVFFLGSIWWLIHVTVVGWLVLCAYLALFFALFGLLARNTKYEIRNTFVSLLLIPSAWVALEYLRSHLFSGFGWNLLGYSQTSWLPMIQIADVTGAGGVSFLIVMVNVAISLLVRDRSRRTHRWAAAAVSLCVVGTWSYGQWRLRQPEGVERLTVAVVQGNIPQEQKWDEASKEWIAQRYEYLTRRATTSNPQLIIWPETSVPGFLGYDPALTDRLRSLAASVGVPLLVGAPVADPERGKLFNSAVLVDADGGIRHRYDKLHLVPFGEFIPGETWMPWLRSILPPIGDFLPGQEYTVFQLDGSGFRAEGSGQGRNPEPRAQSPELRFSTLICFEDIFPDLARRFVQRGAQMLVVITNDAWFGKTAAAYQHAQASTFRAVELRVPVVRAANTGWSGCITERGEWMASVRNAQGKDLFVEGIAACDIFRTFGQTIYRRWGDWVAILCLIIVGGSAIIRRFNAHTRRARRGAPPEA